jgi:predicted  nucleic acid-binding Zn-ribbon protein
MVSAQETIGGALLPNPQAAAQAQVQLTGIDRIQDEEAVRSFLQAVLREKELDDTHDLLGLTIYTLKFDVTLMPGETDSHFYQVQIDLEGGRTRREHLFFNRWIKSFERSINSELLGLQRRWLQDAVSEEERIRLALQASREIKELETRIHSEGSSVYQLRELIAHKHKELSEVQRQRAAIKTADRTPGRPDRLAALSSKTLGINTELENLGHQLEQEQEELLRLRSRARLFAKVVQGPGALETPDQIRELREALARLLLSRYREDLRSGGLGLEKLLSIREEPVPLGDPRKPAEMVYLVGVESRIDQRPKVYENVRSRLHELGQELPFYAYSVEPKEYAQNISDVAAREKLRDMVASFNAVLPKPGIKVGAFQEQLHRSQSTLQAIKRRPLVVGFLDNEKRFGWILGPKFQIDPRGRMRFRHSHVQYSFQASIVVPAWWSSVTLKGAVLGLNPQGRPHTLGALWDGGIEVLLPGDPSAFTSWVLHQTERRPPTLIPHWTGTGKRKRRRVQVGAPASLLIRGTNLWRNPQVYLGSVKADRTEILPDMGGLQAHFNQVPKPASLDPVTQSARVDLTVVTSNGISTLQEEVEILPARP